MSFSILQVLVTALVSAVVSAAVTALIAWWRRSVVRWAITTEVSLFPGLDEFAPERLGKPNDPRDPVYFNVRVFNIGDAPAYGVQFRFPDGKWQPLAGYVPAGGELKISKQVEDSNFRVVTRTIDDASVELRFLGAPVWRARQVRWVVPVMVLKSRRVLHSYFHLPFGLGRVVHKVRDFRKL